MSEPHKLKLTIEDGGVYAELIHLTANAGAPIPTRRQSAPERETDTDE
jgi:hypothetical protein